MSLDLLDRLITDIISVTETLMSLEPVDLECFAQGSKSVEAKNSRNQKPAKISERPMEEGVHRTVC